MEIKFTFDETNVQVGFENQFKIKDLTDKTLVKLLMLKGEKGDNGGATKTSELINDSGFITDADIPTIPTKTSDLNNDSGFITKLVNDLTNYYLKSEIYTKTEVNNLIGQITSFSVEVVQSLPTTDISSTTIYLVARSGSSTGDVYNEYLYINNSWELIGTTAIDLSNYYTKTQTDNLLNGKQPILVSGTNIKTINGNSLLGSGNLDIGVTILEEDTDLKDLKTGLYVTDDGIDITYPSGYNRTQETLIYGNDKIELDNTMVMLVVRTIDGECDGFGQDERIILMKANTYDYSSNSFWEMYMTGYTNKTDATTGDSIYEFNWVQDDRGETIRDNGWETIINEEYLVFKTRKIGKEVFFTLKYTSNQASGSSWYLLDTRPDLCPSTEYLTDYNNVHGYVGLAYGNWDTTINPDRGIDTNGNNLTYDINIMYFYITSDGELVFDEDLIPYSGGTYVANGSYLTDY